MKRLLSLVIIMLLLLSSCGNAEPDSDLGFNGGTAKSSGTAEPMSFEDFSAKYPDKTVLVWAVEEYVRSTRTAEINEYLDSLGCDYAVCFLPLDDGDTAVTTTHIQLIKDMISDNRQLDIIYSGGVYFGIDDCTNAYHSLAEDGILMPLDDYLSGTESGKKLYSLMPEKHWEGLKVSGQIFGLDGSMRTLSYYTGYTVDKAVADEYGFDVNISPCEQLDIIAEIAKEHTVCKSNPFTSTQSYISGVCNDRFGLLGQYAE